MESLRAENEAITKYQFNKEQIAVSLSLSSLSPALSLFFSVTKSEKNDVSLSVHSKLRCLSLRFYISSAEVAGWSLGQISNGLCTNYSA